jgi:hypothetical protein
MVIVVMAFAATVSAAHNGDGVVLPVNTAMAVQVVELVHVEMVIVVMAFAATVSAAHNGDGVVLPVITVSDGSTGGGVVEALVEVEAVLG